MQQQERHFFRLAQSITRLYFFETAQSLCRYTVYSTYIFCVASSIIRLTFVSRRQQLATPCTSRVSKYEDAKMLYL